MHPDYLNNHSHHSVVSKTRVGSSFAATNLCQAFCDRDAAQEQKNKIYFLPGNGVGADDADVRSSLFDVDVVASIFIYELQFESFFHQEI